MLLLHKHAFDVASYHQRVNPEHASRSLSQGLVLSVDVIFQDWLDRRALRAEAFLDPGADHSMISIRWIHEQAEAADAEVLAALYDARSSG